MDTSDTTVNVRPLLLLDIDGVLNPWVKITKNGHLAGDDYTKYTFTDLTDHPSGLSVLLAASHGAALRALMAHYDLVWATTWEHEANRLISPLLGLPADLPVISWPAEARATMRTERRNGSWKTPWIADWLTHHAPGRAWAWVDDEINRYDRTWFKQWYLTHHPAPPHLLVRISHHQALKPADFTYLRTWAQDLTNEPASG